MKLVNFYALAISTQAAINLLKISNIMRDLDETFKGDDKDSDNNNTVELHQVDK